LACVDPGLEANMSVTDALPQTAPGPTSYIQWPGVWAGAFVAAGVSFLLITFGSAIGLAVAPLAPTWRTASVPFSILSGLWILAVAIGSAAAGGYIAGRVRRTWHITHTDEVEFRDGVHGLVVWAVALTLGALLSMGAGAVLATASVNPLSGGQSASGGPVAYEVDRLFRGGPAAIPPTPAVHDEASRALIAASTDSGFTSDDRADLARLVSETTREPIASVQSRVDQSIALVQQKLRAARHAAIILAFITAAAAAAAAVAAAQAARVGGRQRDQVG
jgi:hypothetical protein